MRRAALALLLLAGCTDPTAVRLRGDWSLVADASDGAGDYCILSGRFDLKGTAEAFEGEGELHVTRAGGFHAGAATLEGDRQRVSVGGFDLVVARVGELSASGDWTCDGETGRWLMER